MTISEEMKQMYDDFIHGKIKYEDLPKRTLQESIDITEYAMSLVKKFSPFVC